MLDLFEGARYGCIGKLRWLWILIVDWTPYVEERHPVLRRRVVDAR